MHLPISTRSLCSLQRVAAAPGWVATHSTQHRTADLKAAGPHTPSTGPSRHCHCFLAPSSLVCRAQRGRSPLVVMASAHDAAAGRAAIEEAFAGYKKQFPDVKDISAAELNTLMQGQTGSAQPEVVDVRTPEEQQASGSLKKLLTRVAGYCPASAAGCCTTSWAHARPRQQQCAGVDAARRRHAAGVQAAPGCTGQGHPDCDLLVGGQRHAQRHLAVSFCQRALRVGLQMAVKSHDMVSWLNCSTAGLRSGKYAAELQRQGFRNVRNLHGSLVSWVRALPAPAKGVAQPATQAELS